MTEEAYCRERMKTSELEETLRQIEEEIQRTERDSETKEERLVNCFNREISNLRKIKDDEYARLKKEVTTLQDTYSSKVRKMQSEKDKLVEYLESAELHMIDSLQLSLDNYCSKAVDMQGSPSIDVLDKDVDYAVTETIARLEKTKRDFERELKEVIAQEQRLITENSILSVRICNKKKELNDCSMRLVKSRRNSILVE